MINERTNGINYDILDFVTAVLNRSHTLFMLGECCTSNWTILQYLVQCTWFFTLIRLLHITNNIFPLQLKSVLKTSSTINSNHVLNYVHWQRTLQCMSRIDCQIDEFYVRPRELYSHSQWDLFTTYQKFNKFYNEAIGWISMSQCNVLLVMCRLDLFCQTSNEMNWIDSSFFARLFWIALHKSLEKCISDKIVK